MEKYLLYHIGQRGCGKVAFYSTRRLIAGIDPINAADVLLLDGSHPVDGEPMMCGSCGLPLDSDELEYREDGSP